MAIISELKNAANIRDAWSALGGGKLHGNRGQAFWRGGKGDSVSLDPSRGLWHDFVTGEGGDVIRLVEVVQGCDFRDALAWLSDFTGLSLADAPRRSDNHPDNDWPTDLKFATWWGRAAEALAEHALEELPSWSLQRRVPTALLQTLKLGDAVLVAEYREWRRRFPELTAAMVHAGRLHDARLQRETAFMLRRYLDADETAA